MDFFKQLEYILEIKTPQEKCEAFKLFYTNYLDNHYTFNHQATSVVFTEPSCQSYCILESDATKVKRKKLGSDRGKAIFLHAIAHIEYSAIDLALDAAYRFKKMPKAFYDDWLEVASDEVRHFEMLETLLAEVGSFYGEIPVYYGLFEASLKTQTLLERMAIIPRYFEAGGLDVTPVMIERISLLKDDEKAEHIVEVLKIILDEEEAHVLKGDRWFKYACDEQGLDYGVYFDIVSKYYPDAFPRAKALNIKARQAVGFSCDELKKISTQADC